MLREQLLKLSAYNLWANEKTGSFILAAGSEKADLPQLSSFDSIRKTMYHIWDAEWIWLQRLQGVISVSGPPSVGYINKLDEGLNTMFDNSKKIKSCIENYSEDDLQQILSYTNVNKVPFQSKIADIITHCLNHSTYHRGQIITMLRGVGFNLVSSTDFITYCRILEKQV